jgi:CDP-6-deoxy-D-xylo-4-hexulose-3-dehydrase
MTGNLMNPQEIRQEISKLVELYASTELAPKDFVPG